MRLPLPLLLPSWLSYSMRPRRSLSLLANFLLANRPRARKFPPSPPSRVAFFLIFHFVLSYSALKRKTGGNPQTPLGWCLSNLSYDSNWRNLGSTYETLVKHLLEIKNTHLMFYFNINHFFAIIRVRFFIVIFYSNVCSIIFKWNLLKI